MSQILIDLTHTFTSDMPVFPGDPKPILEQVAFIDQDSFNDHQLTTVMHVGTHMDAPKHMIKNGNRIDELKIDSFFGPGILIDVTGEKFIDEKVLDNIRIVKGSIVILYTGLGSKYRSEEYFRDNPSLTEGFARKMVEMGVKMVGMDMLGPDQDTHWPAHKVLLSNGVLILENLTNLDQLLKCKSFEIIALPTKIQSDAAPVRVVARLKTR